MTAGTAYLALSAAMEIVRRAFPNAVVDEDLEGQLVIYTGAGVDRDDNVCAIPENQE